MPVSFQMIRKSTGEPESFAKIDEELCAELNVPCDADKYYMGWYNLVGLRAALGTPLDEQYADELAHATDDAAQWIKVISWLNERFETRAWR